MIKYAASDMQLHIHSDASCLSEPEAKSRAGGYCCLGNKQTNPIQHNGAVHVLASIIKHAMSSAAEAELGALSS